MIRRFLSWLVAPRQRITCPRCGCEPDWPDGCGCYYLALREDRERKDIIARLSKWQRER